MAHACYIYEGDSPNTNLLKEFKMQKVILIGNVGNPPEMRYVPSGQAVTNFSLATNESFKNAAGEKVKKTTWFRIQAWGKMAETVNQYVTKGMKVAVTGKLIATDKGDCRVWTAQDGTSRASFEINAREVEFLGGTAHADGGEAADEEQPATQGEGLAEGEIPF